MWWAMGCIIAAPVDMLMQTSQHRTPRMVPWKFGPHAHQQRAIIDCPCKVLEMVSIIHIQQGQDVRHASLLHPMPSLDAPLHGEAENLIGHYDLFMGPPLLFDLVVDVKNVHPM